MKARGLADYIFKRGNGHLSQQGNSVKLSVFLPKIITTLKGDNLWCRSVYSLPNLGGPASAKACKLLLSLFTPQRSQMTIRPQQRNRSLVTGELFGMQNNSPE